MNEDDDLERRLRDALSRPRRGDAVGTDEFLSRVHHGAKIRRVRRGVAVAAAAVLAVAGGGVAVDASGLIGGEKAPVAAGDRTPFTELATNTPTTPDTPSPTATVPSPSKQSSGSPYGSKVTVQISPSGPIAADQVDPVSLTATGTQHQWVLAKTPGNACGRVQCATVFATDQHGADGSWTDLGQLPAPPVTGGQPTPETVSQLRFTLRQDGSGQYDGWAYGDAYWSTHDSGHTWSNVGAPPGEVTHLESWGDYVYAAVSSPSLGGADLYRSPTTEDAWQRVTVSNPGLTSVQSLVTANGLVALIDAGSLHPVVYLSADGTSWRRERPCPSGTDPRTLSAASEQVDAQTTVSSLWVTCQGATSAVFTYTDTTDLGTWHPAGTSYPPTAVAAAQARDTAFVAGDGVVGIQKLSVSNGVTTVPVPGLRTPVFFGFTNPSYGYLLDSSGHIVSTTNGGTNWTPYAVSDTTP